MRRPNKPRLFIELSGGLIQNIITDIPDCQITVAEYDLKSMIDEEEEGCLPCYSRHPCYVTADYPADYRTDFMQALGRNLDALESDQILAQVKERLQNLLETANPTITSWNAVMAIVKDCHQLLGGKERDLTEGEK